MRHILQEIFKISQSQAKVLFLVVVHIDYVSFLLGDLVRFGVKKSVKKRK